MNYSVQFFIDKFSAIPEDRWVIGEFSDFSDNNNCCALGHCGVRNNMGTLEGTALGKLFKILCPDDSFVAQVNDGEATQYGQQTPKTRILAALYDIKSLQEKPAQPMYQDLTESLAILPVDETSDIVGEKIFSNQ